jgi:hypothetical protein
MVFWDGADEEITGLNGVIEDRSIAGEPCRRRNNRAAYLELSFTGLRSCTTPHLEEVTPLTEALRTPRLAIAHSTGKIPIR